MGHLAAKFDGAGLLMRSCARAGGFTIVEMVVAMVIFAVLAALSVPTMSVWIRNVRVRTVADAVQNGVRLAQAEALRRSRPVVFSLTTSTAPQSGFTASANGTYWSINTVPVITGEASVFIQSGVLATTASGVGITGPAAICFNSIGRLAANSATTIPGATCTLPTASPPVQTYNIATTGTTTANDRPLNVQVALGGQVHMCDPAFVLSSANPEGC